MAQTEALELKCGVYFLPVAHHGASVLCSEHDWRPFDSARETLHSGGFLFSRWSVKKTGMAVRKPGF